MTEPKRKQADQELISAVWEEARDLIKRLEGSSVQRFAVEAGDTRIEIERGIPSGIAAGPVSFSAAATAGDAATDGAADMDSRHQIKAPLVGTFYRASGPGADPYVKEGDSIEVGQTVAIVEAMKLMNQVTSDVAGTVAEITVDDGSWVEFEQVLMLIEPKDA